MANQRAEGKRLIGAQATPALWGAVDVWLSRNRNATVTDFVIDAIVEKLIKENIPFDHDSVNVDFRGRRPALNSNLHSTDAYVLNESSSTPAEVAERTQKILSGEAETKPANYRKKRATAKTKAKGLPPTADPN